MKYLGDQFQLCFCVCNGNTKLLYLQYFYIGNTTGILRGNLLVAAYALSCLCIQVSSEISDFTSCVDARSEILHIRCA